MPVGVLDANKCSVKADDGPLGPLIWIVQQAVSDVPWCGRGDVDKYRDSRLEKQKSSEWDRLRLLQA